MIRPGETTCPLCGGRLVKSGKSKRKLRTKNNSLSTLLVQRWQCTECHHVHRELTDDILPYKRFEAEIIKGVQEGLIDSGVLGFEDYPTEETMKKWKKHDYAMK